MKAPKLKGMFRNVRTTPRSFSFKTRHTYGNREDWDGRKQRVELGLVLGEDDPSSSSNSKQKPQLSFRKRRISNKKAARTAMLRTLVIGAFLLFITYRLLIWADTTEWGTMIEFIQSNG